ncbi:MAG TPA: endopeptidase La [Ktedonobacterales bacterium]|nr:endopeptidase La [Ktedonobacterales bacterium]
MFDDKPPHDVTSADATPGPSPDDASPIDTSTTGPDSLRLTDVTDATWSATAAVDVEDSDDDGADGADGADDDDGADGADARVTAAADAAIEARVAGGVGSAAGAAGPRDESRVDGDVTIPATLPILPVKDLVVYPFSVTPIAVEDERSIRLLEDAMEGDHLVGAFAQKDEDVVNAGPDDCYRVGALGRIARFTRTAEGGAQIVLQGLDRIAIDEYTTTEPYLRARIHEEPEPIPTGLEVEVLKRNIAELFQRIINLVQYLPDQLSMAVSNMNDPRQLVYLIAGNLQTDIELRQDLLELNPVRAKLERLNTFLMSEYEKLEVSKKVQTDAQEEMSKAQREYYLREQLKAIQKELGEENDEIATVSELREQIETAHMSEEALKEAKRELARLERLPAAAPEYSVIRSYLETLVALPWDKSTAKPIDVTYARQVLDEDHYDLVKVKDRILEYLAVRRLKADRQGADPITGATPTDAAPGEAKDGVKAEVKAEMLATDGTKPDTAKDAPKKAPINREPILCFVGPPGVGKTSLGQSIAKSLGREFVRMSFGGIHDEAEIRGHRRTYIGALPGRILQSLRRAGTNDPVFMLDEVDKLTADWRGDPASALLEVLDPEQNHSFRDNYLDLAFDLSKVMFIATANSLDPIPAPLRDRMEVLELAGYTEDEKLHIARRYLLPKQIKANSLTDTEVIMADETILAIIRQYTREAGVRGLEREIGAVCRKSARRIAEGGVGLGEVKPDQLRELLGRPRHFTEAAERIDRPGVVTGLVWTPTGGDIIFVEAAMTPSNESGLTLTGQLGDVMKESAMAAFTYVRSNAQALHIDPRFFDKRQIHIHVPEGAIAKDGPSAGVTMVTAIASLATDRRVRSDVAMTGEISLRGRVLPIGGLKEKVLAAHRAGIRTVILPKRNEDDLEDLPQELRDEMTFVPVEDAREVINVALDGWPFKRSGQAGGDTRTPDEQEPGAASGLSALPGPNPAPTTPASPTTPAHPALNPTVFPIPPIQPNQPGQPTRP